MCVAVTPGWPGSLHTLQEMAQPEGSVRLTFSSQLPVAERMSWNILPEPSFEGPEEFHREPLGTGGDVL